MIELQQNWAGNLTYSAARLHYPETVAQVQDLVRHATKLRVLGSRHSFNRIADSTEDQLSLERFDPTGVIDPVRHTVTVAGGVKYGQLCRQLDQAGYAVPNLASLPHISVAGACATATHGSGDHNGNLATSVSAMELVRADGEVITVSRAQSGDEWPGMVVSLGALGVITHLTLDLVPSFKVRQDVYENLPLTQLEAHFDTITASTYSVSCFTDWRSPVFNQVWLKSRVLDGEAFEAPAELFGATPARTNLHPIPGVSAVNCTEQMGVPGPWYERLPHFRMDFMPSSGEELQTEYLVPRQNAIPALNAIARLRQQIVPLLQIAEIRTIAADNLWLSPCYQQACVGFHFTWHPNWSAVSQLLPVLEAELAPFKARPHWGKLFTMSASQVQALYPKLPDFRQLLGNYDPHGKFRNAFLDTCIFGD